MLPPNYDGDTIPTPHGIRAHQVPGIVLTNMMCVDVT